MSKIICDAKSVYELTGVNTNADLITSNLFRDCFGGRKSVLVQEEDGTLSLIADNLDKCDWDYRAKNLDRIFYHYTYLTYYGPEGRRPQSEYATFEEALKACVHMDNKIQIPGDLGLDYVDKILKGYEITKAYDNVPDTKFYVYKRPCQEVLDQIHENDDCINEKAYSLFKNEDSKQKIKSYIFDKRDSRYSGLNTLMTAKNLGAVLVTSPLNVQEITGLSYEWLLENECYALYRKNDESVYIISAVAVENRTPIYESTGFKEAFSLMDLKGTIGIGEGHFMISRFEQLVPKDYTYITDDLRLWREERSGEDLAYYIIVAKATGYAIDGAVNYAVAKNEAYESFTEDDVYQEYNRLKHEFMDIHEVDATLDAYDPCVYDSTRSVYPGVASDYIIPVDGNTIRIDNGEFIKDKYGYIHATSDVARTVCFNEPARLTHEILLDVLRDKIIPHIEVGMKFSDIWHMGVDAMVVHERRFKDLGMFPPKADFKTLYKRNIGHGMSKQTRTANFITEENHYVLKDGTVGNIELPINFRDHILAVEDMWFATKDGTVNITVD